MGTTSDHEYIDIELEFQDVDDKSDPFFVIKTEGWSCDTEAEFVELIRRAKNVLRNVIDNG